MPIDHFSDLNIAVLLPCFNEGKSIASVVLGFRKALPRARIFVYNNNSSDDTAEQAARAGATVVPSRRQGKGNVVRQMFADIDADIYLMADGDGTYDPSAAPRMVQTLLDDRADMVVGTRRNVTQDAGRNGHAIGNRLFNSVYKTLFGNEFTDIFSGYRAFTRRFAKSFPASSAGFEIETEMSVHASTLRLPVSEVEFDYGRRMEGAPSKLSTFRDGFRILRMMGMLMKETRPFVFFGYVSVALFAASVFFMAPVIRDYLATGLVDRLPTWMLAMTLLLGAMMTFIAGVVLDSVARGRAEQKRIHYLSIAPSRGEQFRPGTTSLFDRRQDTTPTSSPAQRGADQR
ncbi:glycosyltransferase [Hyphomonas johnsonii]|uniref:Glycosyltransferase n=1 Tax=Hyphomonas johnsonii MHS-2 TaxID=1280950 RepID=A0A059FMC2_9PROT|nr:glycosyltransferase [Hyphomonas johnsonii]KCZ91593.1 glycosyltransferase [Hyphomonas johnsonii MHS-2]